MQENNPKENIDDILKRLEQSPLFRLSLSSKELFHSNFIAWCCDTWPEEMASVFSSFLPNQVSSKKTPVRREHHNHDLEIEIGTNDLLVIELKIKSTPYKDQLKKYSEDCYKKYENGKIHFALISPVCPDFFNKNEFETDGGKVWHWIGLRELAEKIEEKLIKNTTSDDLYKIGLLKDYIYFVTHLMKLLESFKIGFEDEDENKPFFIKKDVIKRLQEVRLHDLVYKYRFNQLAERLNEQLPKNEYEKIKISTDMTRGTGLVTVECSLDKDIAIGVQLQERQFKHYILFSNAADEAKAPDIIRKIQNLNYRWFNFSDESLHENNMRKEICQYDGKFQYQYRLVNENLSSEKVSELIRVHIKELYKEHKDEIYSVIREILK